MRRVDDELDALALDQVDDIRPAFFHLVDALDLQTGVFQHVAPCRAVATMLKPSSTKRFASSGM